MMAKALEENGAKVYIIGRRKEVLEKAAREEAVQQLPQQLSIHRARQTTGSN